MSTACSDSILTEAHWLMHIKLDLLLFIPPSPTHTMFLVTIEGNMLVSDGAAAD